MKATVAIILRVFLLLSVFVAPVLAQAPGSQQEQPEFIRQGQQLMREGKWMPRWRCTVATPGFCLQTWPQGVFWI